MLSTNGATNVANRQHFGLYHKKEAVSTYIDTASFSFVENGILLVGILAELSENAHC